MTDISVSMCSADPRSLHVASFNCAASGFFDAIFRIVLDSNYAAWSWLLRRALHRFPLLLLMKSSTLARLSSLAGRFRFLFGCSHFLSDNEIARYQQSWKGKPKLELIWAYHKSRH